MKVTRANVEACILREEVSTRGGGVEIALDRFGFKGERMAAYQNYLGGGLLGAVCVNDTIRANFSGRAAVTKQLRYSSEFEKLDQIGEVLKRYFHEKTNPGEDTWEGSDYESNQRRPSSAY